MKIYKIIPVLFIAVALWLTPGICKLYGQQDNTMYFMKLVPQANYLNPAYQSEYNLYLGAPAFASQHYNLNLGLSFNDIFYYDPELDSVVTFLATREYQDNFFKKLNRSGNLLSLENSLSIGSFGFRIKELYLSFDIQAKMN